MAPAVSPSATMPRRDSNRPTRSKCKSKSKSNPPVPVPVPVARPLPHEQTKSPLRNPPPRPSQPVVIAVVIVAVVIAPAHRPLRSREKAARVTPRHATTSPPRARHDTRTLRATRRAWPSWAAVCETTKYYKAVWRQAATATTHKSGMGSRRSTVGSGQSQQCKPTRRRESKRASAREKDDGKQAKLRRARGQQTGCGRHNRHFGTQSRRGRRLHPSTRAPTESKSPRCSLPPPPCTLTVSDVWTCESLRSTFGAQSTGRSRRTPAWRSTSVGRSTARRGWSRRSRPSTCAPGGQ